MPPSNVVHLVTATFLMTAFGRPFTVAGFGNWFRKCCNEAGLPVIYLLHGANADESQWADVGVAEAAAEGRVTGTLPPVILVVPRRLDDSGQPRPDG